MAGISPELLRRSRDLLLECEEFDSNDKLKAVIRAHAPLKTWVNSLPQENANSARVDAVISYLHDKSRSDTQENALILLVRLLGARIPEEDSRHQQLLDLADELEKILGNKSTDIRGEKHPIYNQRPKPGPIKNRYAFLVGVNSYIDSNFRPLNFCINDVLALKKTLEESKYTVVCLHDGLSNTEPRFPTRENIESELKRLCQIITPDDLLLVHFSCHGKLANGMPVLIAYNTRANILAKTGLTLEQVKVHMRSSPAKRLVLTLDACHMGVEIGRGVEDPEFIHHVYELAEGFALIAASTAQQIAQELPDEQCGVFTYYLLEALTGKADRDNKHFITVDDIKTYVLDNLRRWNVTNGGTIQEPTAYTEGLGDIILADYRNHPE